jgi:hypothetical protein
MTLVDQNMIGPLYARSTPRLIKGERNFPPLNDSQQLEYNRPLA